jgi:hypothetical protein
MTTKDILFSDDIKAKDIADHILQYCVTQYSKDGKSAAGKRMSRVSQCRALYNDDRDPSEYDYITNPRVKQIKDDCGNVRTETFTLPAQIRNIPIVKSYSRVLLSEERNRPLVLRAYTTDAESASLREDDMLKKINSIETSRFVNKQIALQLQMQAIALQSAINEKQVEEVQDEMEKRAMIGQLNQSLDSLNQIIQEETNITRREFEKFKTYYFKDYKTINESFAELSCNYAVQEQRLRMVLNRVFEDRIVTSQSYIHSDWMPGMTDPVFRRVVPENLYLPDNEHVDYIHQNQWCVELNYMTYDNILSEFGMYITPQIREELSGEMGFTYGNPALRDFNQQLPDGTPVRPSIFTKVHATTAGFMVYRIYWKKDRRVPVLIKKNKHAKKGETRPDFIKVIEQDEADTMLRDKDKMAARGEKIEYRYVQDLYMAIKVGKKTFLYCDLHPVQLRSEADKTSIALPYIGTADNLYYQSESLIWETKDLQEMYNILFYQRELLWLLSGVRGIVYDKSQLPKDQDIEDMIYYARQGFIFIESEDENGRPRQFNQFQNYDQTVSPAIQYVENSLAQLQMLIGQIMGITDARLGIIKPTDQVGTAQLSYNQSSLITERFFQEHEDITELAFSRHANLCKIAYKNGVDKGIMVTGERVMERMFIPKDGMRGDYKIMMKSGRAEAKVMEDYKGTARQLFARGQMPSSLFIDTLTSTSLVEIRTLIKAHEDLALQMQQQNVQNQQAHEEKIAQMKAQIDMQMLQFTEKAKTDRDQFAAQLKEKELQVKAQIDMQKTDKEMGMWAKDIDVKAQSSKYAVDKDFQVEMMYLLQQRKEMAVQNKNNQVAMLLDTMKTELQLGAKKEKVKD